MTTGLKILFLEDNPADAEMVQRVLSKENLSAEYYPAMTRDQFIEGLDTFHPDLILSDNSLPQFSATEALEIFRQQSLFIPFILVTGTVSEEFAAGIIKLGADDFILKDRLARLPAAIDNALKQKKAEKEKQEALRQLKQSEENLVAIFENTAEGFILTDIQCVIKAFNENGKKYVFFNTNKELTVGQNLFDFIKPSKVPEIQEIILKVLTGEKIQFDAEYNQDGAQSWLNFSITPVWKNEKIEGICIGARDISERKHAEDRQREMEQEILTQKVQEQKKRQRAIIRAQEKERNYIGQELHDNVNQILAGAKLHLNRIHEEDAGYEMIKYPLELINLSIHEIRLLGKKLVSPVKDINLQEMVRTLLETFGDAEIKTDFEYHVPIVIGDELSLNIYRIIQEQVTNVMKHSEAKHMQIFIGIDANNNCMVVISDDGKGFDPDLKRKGIGISNMMNRIESFNGKMHVESAPGSGCKIIIHIPF